MDLVMILNTEEGKSPTKRVPTAVIHKTLLKTREEAREDEREEEAVSVSFFM